MPNGLEVGDLSPTSHQRERAGQLPGVDIASEMIVDASEASRRQSDFFRFHEHVNVLTPDQSSTGALHGRGFLGHSQSINRPYESAAIVLPCTLVAGGRIRSGRDTHAGASR